MRVDFVDSRLGQSQKGSRLVMADSEKGTGLGRGWKTRPWEDWVKDLRVFQVEEKRFRGT